MPADPHLSHSGAALLSLLNRVSKSDSFIFGHHNDDIEGQHFSSYFHFNGPGEGVPLQSDVLTATHGQFPGMTGFNLDWVGEEQAEPEAWGRFIRQWSKRASSSSFSGRTTIQSLAAVQGSRWLPITEFCQVAPRTNVGTNGWIVLPTG